MFTDIILFASGLALLVAGAELLVRGASRLALRLGIPPIIIGLTVVAYGTSAPEMIVSAKGALSGQADIALGNVIGSNIFNILLILGASAVVAPLIVSRQMIWQEVPIMIGVSFLALGLSLDGQVSRLDGFILIALLAAYTVLQVRLALRKPETAPSDPVTGNPGGVWTNVGLIVGGLAVLVLGARWLLTSSIDIARALGVSELVIGLTIVAAGTSLPEVATSILATFRGQRDIAVGNVIGSNIYNVLGVLGLAAVLSPGGVGVSNAVLTFDFPVMLATAVACLPIFLSGHRIERWEGGVFLAYYLSYVAYLILDAQGHDALPAFSGAMLTFVIPITVLTVLIALSRSRSASNAARS